MSTDVNSLLCFCEGSHDVSFVSSVLERLMDFKIKEKIKFSEMPAPFNNLFKTRVTNYASQDIAIDFAYRFFIPSAVLYKKGIYIYIFDCGGNNQYKKVSSFLIDHISIFDEASVFPQGANEITKNCKYLFLYDADNRGVDLISDQIKEKLGKIGDKDFMNGTWDGSESKFGKVMQDKAVFVLSKTPQEGTLEDILESLFDFTHKDIMSKTKTAICDIHKWNIENNNKDELIAELARYKKAILTVIGQKSEPGSALSVILKNKNFLTKEALEENSNVTEFVLFLNEFLSF